MKQERNRPAYIKKHEDAKRETQELRKHEDNMEIVSALNRLTEHLTTERIKEENSDRKKARRERLTIGLVLATVVATGIGDYYFYGQREEMKRAYDPIQSSADAAQKSASAALSQIKVMQSDQRPWVAVRYFIDGDMTRNNTGDAFFDIAFNFEALGKAPATHVELAAEIVANNSEYLEQVRLCDTNAGRRTITPTLFPSQTFSYKRRLWLQRKDMGLLRPDSNLHIATLVACAHYQDGLTGETHKTPLLARLGTTTPDRTTLREVFDIRDGTIPKDWLGIEPIGISLPAD